MPCSFVCRTIRVSILTCSFLLTHAVLALILGAFLRPGRNAFPVLQIILPVAFIAITFLIHIGSEAIGFVVCPPTVVDISIGVEELASSTRLVILPLTNIARVAIPHHGAST